MFLFIFLAVTFFNANKAVLFEDETVVFEGTFFWRVNLIPSSYFKKNKSNTDITLYNC